MLHDHVAGNSKDDDDNGDDSGIVVVGYYMLCFFMWSIITCGSKDYFMR